MKIFVIGPVRYKNKGKNLLKLVNTLKKKGFNVFSVLDKKLDFTKDYRYNRKYSKKIYKEAEKFIKNKVDVVVTDLRGPSDGRTIEQFLAHKYDKPVIGYAPRPVFSPWSVLHVNEITTSLNGLLKLLKNYSKKREDKISSIFRIFQKIKEKN